MVKLEDFKVGEIKKMVSKYNKQVKIGPISKLNKTQLIEHIRKHPKLTVQENEKGVRISVKGEVNVGDKKIKIKKDKKPEPEPKAQLGQSGIGKKRKREEKPINYKKPAKEVPAEKPKPKIPSITVTEEEKPKKKVIKVRGKYITVKPKEVKADKMDMPKSKAKIRVAPKKEEPKKEEPKKEEKKEEDIIKNMKEIVDKYNKEEIKKQTKITRKNNDVFTKPFLNLAQKIENQLKTINNPFEFLKKHVELNEKYADTTKNFVRRIRIQLKKNEEEEEKKKEEPKMSKKEMIANLRKHNKENK